jgi:non-specific serine/threonine protein kinase
VVMYECVTGEKPPEVLERLHAGLGKPLAEGRWPGYGKRFLSAIDAAMIVKPEERPQSITEWLAMFGKPAGEDENDADEATRFFPKQVQAEEIVPVAPTNGDRKVPVETGVPGDRKEARFKRAGEETDAKRKLESKRAAAAGGANVTEESAGEAPPAVSASTAAAPSKDAPRAWPPRAKNGDEAAVEKKKPNMILMGGAAAALLALVGVGAYTLRGGGSENDSGLQMAKPAPTPDTGQASSVLGPSTAPMPASEMPSNGTDASAAPQTPQPPAAAPDPSQALRTEKAKTAAAEAQLASLKKAQARMAASAVPGAPTAANRRANQKAAAAAQAASSESDAGVSAAKMAQFNSTVGEARSMAKQAMRSSNPQNVQLAKNYDKYLKTLDASMRGIQSDREADKLIKSANQTKAYIQFLLRQP